MSGDEVQVAPEDLAGKATQIRGLSWSSTAAQPSLVSPDALDTSGVAITNLGVNAEAMWAHQEFGRLEGLRLAQTLDNVSAAYADVDKISGEDLDATMGGPGSAGAADGTVYPRSIDLPAPARPENMPIPKGQLVSAQMLFPPEAQRALEAGDGGASLRAAAQMWRSNAQSLAASAQPFETNSLRWEGEAADAAYAKFTAYRDWLISLAGAWQRLAGEAARIADAHSVAKRDNEPIAEDFERLQQEIAQHPASADNLRKTVQMAALQNQSEEIRHQYVRDGKPHQIQPEDPPSPVVSDIPVTAEEHRRASRPLPNERPIQGQGPDRGQGPGTGRNGGSPTGGESSLPPESPAVSQTAAAEQVARGAPQGSPGGGSPGAGQQGAGQQRAGMPNSPKRGSRLPADASLRPAASGLAGSSGGGAGAAAGSGGAGPGSALLPSVGAETVAPAPVAVPAVQAAAGGAAAGVMAGGGMGGMAPMMQGAKGEGSGDRKRNPRLAEDEEIYTEDRPWTEAVIGNRARRRGARGDIKNDKMNDTQKESQ